MSRPAAFIHFGLPKCGSTFLQGVWGEDKRYTAADLTGAAQACRQLAAKGQTTALPKLDFSLRARAGTTLVASSEGFSWAFLGRPQLLERIRVLHTVGAKVTGAAGISDTALFMVRNPLDWIRAAHEQTIKEGGWLNGGEFLAQRRALVECVLDLKHIQSAFKGPFKRVLFLSADEMRQDPEAFWERYARLLRVPRPEAAAIQTVRESSAFSNTSLKTRAPLLARLNRVMGGVGSIWEAREGLPPDLLKERELLLPKYHQTRVWAARRAAEASTDTELEALIGGAHAEMSAGFSDLPLDDALKAYLRTHFCDVLDAHDTVPDALKADYRTALA